MRQRPRWLTVVIVCCAAAAAGAEEKPDARLQEAQAAFDEAKKLQEAGKYAEAIARAEHALEQPSGRRRIAQWPGQAHPFIALGRDAPLRALGPHPTDSQ